MNEPSAMDDEFDTVAMWTAQAVGALGDEYAIPAGCKGSGSPTALTWLANQIGLGPGLVLIDSGAGVGGAAAFAATSTGVDVVLAEPMLGACWAARQLFDYPIVAAQGQALPFPDGQFDAGWSLGVLCTSGDQLGVLRELRRVVRTGGRLGLLVFTRTVDQLPEQPEGNDFPSQTALDQMLNEAGWTSLDQRVLSDFPEPPAQWQRQVDAISNWIKREHADDDRLAVSEHQQSVMTELLTEKLIVGRLVVAD